MKIIDSSTCNFEREPLIAPFGFKGGYLSELWQSVVGIADKGGPVQVGLGTQSVLWSDAAVFTDHSEAAGNAMMFLCTEFAVRKALNTSWETPLDLLESVLPETYEFAKTITRNPDLRLTFVLNALVALDNAAWLLLRQRLGGGLFEDLLPEDIRPVCPARHDRLACIPLMSYNVPLPAIVEEVENGHFFLKIKIGSDPEKNGDQDAMLAWDMGRLEEIHDAVKNLRTPYTESGHVLYYLDANGRYDSKQRLTAFLNFADKIGALERILLIEEPFAEDDMTDVSDLPVRIAADESAHSDHDALARIRQGYKAIALKPIAKTLSMSLNVVRLAHEHQIPCFCADLTVNPILVDWNKNLAARLPSLPGIKIGVLESNGRQNYKNWGTMESYHPHSGASWTQPQDGIFHLGADFYRVSGGIFDSPAHYLELLK